MMGMAIRCQDHESNYISFPESFLGYLANVFELIITRVFWFGLFIFSTARLIANLLGIVGMIYCERSLSRRIRGARRMGDGVVSIDWHEYRNGWQHVEDEVIAEALVTIYVNGMELTTIMASPEDLDDLVLGFLKNEQLIDDLQDIDHIHLSKNHCCVDVWLTQTIEKPERVIITSSCGGGITFTDPLIDIEPLEYDFSISPKRLFQLFQRLHFPGSLYSRARGVHTAGLSDGENILAVAEDVGRHNAVDKLLGKCLVRGIYTEGRLLLATGRVSSEMLRKGALMGCPIIASRNSVTSMSIAMARAWRITLIGYVRQQTLRVYSHPERVES
jgi:FdhD protein